MPTTLHGFSVAEMKEMYARAGVNVARSGPGKGLRIDRWLYTEPYFKVAAVSNSSELLRPFRGKWSRGRDAIKRVVWALAEGETCVASLSVKLTADDFTSCPKTLEYWVQDVVAECAAIEEARRGGSGFVTFAVQVLSDRLPLIVVAISVGKRCQAPAIVAEQPWWTYPVVPSPQSRARAGGARPVRKQAKSASKVKVKSKQRK